MYTHTHTHAHAHTNEIIPLTLCFILLIIIKKRNIVPHPYGEKSSGEIAFFFPSEEKLGEELDKVFELYIS